MKCANKRSLALAALSLVLLAASLAAYFLQGREIRFLLSAGPLRLRRTELFPSSTLPGPDR